MATKNPPPTKEQFVQHLLKRGVSEERAKRLADEAERQGLLAKAAPNPAPKVDAAAVEKAKREVETFTAYPAKHLRMLSMAPFKSPRTKLCRFGTVIYNSAKWSGVRKRYFHVFEDGLKRTVWLTKSGHIIAAGPARNTARGIDDFSLIHRLGKRAKSLDEVIRHAKGWAKLADLEAVSQPCKKCSKTLRYDGDGSPQRWVCPRCGGETPRYRLNGGAVYYDADAKWLVAVAKVS